MTRIVKSLLNRQLLAVVVFTAALVPQGLKAADVQCPLGNATRHGTYVVFGTGSIVGLGPVAVVGEITYDGEGNEHAHYTASLNGTIHKDVKVTGVYTVNSDCTGWVTESDGSHYSFVMSPDGSKVSWIQTDAGTVISGTEVRLRNLDWDY
jgi:hypothetical protein